MAFGLEPDARRRVAVELARTAGLYPHLDPKTLWLETLPGGVLVGGVSNATAVAAPRVYADRDERRIVLFDGLPIDASGRLRAHDARVLSDAWESLPAALEGRFVAVRVDRTGPTIELLTDPTGVAQVYVSEEGGSSIVSNNADLVARARGLTEIDPLGAAMFVTMDWVAGDRTLRRGVTVVPGAQVWRWVNGDRAWGKRTYWTVAEHGGHADSEADPELVDAIIDHLARFATAAAAVNGRVNAPITSGKDSRMLATVLMTRGIPTAYWTKGDERSLDVRNGTTIAQRYGLPHRVANRPTLPPGTYVDPTGAIAADWQAMSARWVARTDGIASLMNIGNILGEPASVERIDVSMTGLGAEIASHAMEYPALFREHRTRVVMNYLGARRVDHQRGLATRAAFGLARDYLRATLSTLHDQGARPDNLPKVWYVADKCRRWAPMNSRELAQTEDKVTAFMTRPYIEMSLRLRPDVRWRGHLHRRVIASLVPQLELDPPPALPWNVELPQRSRPAQIFDLVRPYMPYDLRRALVSARDRVKPPVVYRSPTVPYDESTWIEANLPFIRDVIMAQSSSSLWSIVDRSVVGRLLQPSTSPDRRRLSENVLFATLTMFEHERVDRDLRATDPPEQFMATVSPDT